MGGGGESEEGGGRGTLGEEWGGCSSVAATCESWSPLPSQQVGWAVRVGASERTGGQQDGRYPSSSHQLNVSAFPGKRGSRPLALGGSFC